MVCGEEVPFGLAYALGTRLAQKVGYGVERSLSVLSLDAASVTVRFVTANDPSAASDPEVIPVYSADIFLQSYARYLLRDADTEDWARECICQALAENTPLEQFGKSWIGLIQDWLDYLSTFEWS